MTELESMVAGRTEDEILAMTCKTRHLWYRIISPEEKEAAMGVVDIARRAKISASLTGKSTGGVISEKTKANMSMAAIERWKDLEYKDKHSGENNPMKRPEVRAKISGENSYNWRGGASFEPYCPAFNDQLKESIRNRDDRTCVFCGKGEIQNGERLSVHHIDGDKMQGCDGTKWHLCALCRSCNSRPDTIEKEFLIITNQRRNAGCLK